MITEEFSERLRETIAICDLHYQRMNFAWENIEKYFPLTENIQNQITQIELAFFDQLIYRFSKPNPKFSDT